MKRYVLGTLLGLSAFPLLLGCSLASATSAAAQAAANNKEFEDFTQIERDAAKAQARKAHFSSFRVCGDPGNMPFSNIKQEGFENKIADVIATALGTKATYFWRPYIERGLTRQTFDTNECDILMDVPANYESALTTFPIYGSTYVLASRTDRHYDFKGLSDPLLRTLQIGAYELSALRQSLANHGIVANVHVHEVSHDGDLVEEHQPWWQVKEVVDGKIDVAAVWGPFAGWLKAKGAPLTLQPTNRMDDIIPMEFEMAIGLRKTDAVTKYAIEAVLNDHRDEIAKILADYGVPLIECSDCLVSGAIKAHGIYTSPTISAEELAKLHRDKPVVSREKLEGWLKDGADVDAEFADAVLASDNARIDFLLSKGADINKRDLQGYTPLTSAVRLGSFDTATHLLDKGAKVDVADSDGWKPVLHAVLRNDVPAIQLLLKNGADVETAAPGGFTPLAVAVEEKKFDAAKALIDDGAKVDRPASAKKVTPLMVTASEPPPESRVRKLQQTLTSIDIARELVKHGADVNAATTEGVTALMIAAARDNAPMIGLLLQSGAKPDLKSADGETAKEIAAKNDAGSATRMLDLFAKTSTR
jgi:quinoprotein dehydrogenase-associated probable ABC transporter substrate-binding protein